MTMTEQHPQRERAQQDQNAERAAQAERERARREGNRIDLLANVAEQNLEAAEDERDDRTRYEDAFQVLRWLIGADWAERTVDHDVVLHDEHGSLDRQKITEFIDLILSGHSSLQARKALLHQQRYGAQADQTRRAVAAAKEVSGGLHRYADGPLVAHQRPSAPALPAGSVPAPSNGETLPRREPGVAGAAVTAVQGYIDGSEHVEHVDEDPQWSTMQAAAIALEGEAKGELRPATVQRLRDEGFGKKAPAAVPDFGPPAPAAFRATAIPQQRDQRPTERMPAIREAADEEPEPVVKGPFSEAGAGVESSPSGSRARNGSGGEGSD